MLTHEESTILRDTFTNIITKYWEKVVPNNVQGDSEEHKKAVDFNNYLCEVRDKLQDQLGGGSPNPDKTDLFPEIYDPNGNYESIIQSRDIVSLYKNLLGEYLTLVDATFSDREQREAQKSVIRRMIDKHRGTLLHWIFASKLKGNEFVPGATISGATFPF